MLSKLVDRLRNPGFATKAAAFGALLLAVCIALTVFGNWGTAGYGPDDCAVAAQEPGTEAVAGEATTGLRVVKVEPDKTTLNRDICFVVEGVSAAAEEGETTLHVFFDGRQLPARTSTAANPEYQTVAAKKVPGQQRLVLRLEAPASATPELSGFWRDVARAAAVPDNTWGSREVQLGVSPSATIPPELTAGFTLVLLYPFALMTGALSLVAFAVSFGSLAFTTSILRDNSRTLAQAAEEAVAESRRVQADPAATPEARAAAHKKAARAKGRLETALKRVEAARTPLQGTAEEAQAKRRAAAFAGSLPSGSYSLARTQMALWLFLTVTGFIYIWFGVGQTLDVMTPQIVTLLGIQAATGVAAIMADTDTGAATRNGRSFFSDILNSDGGPKVHRVQALAWTVVLALIFVWNVVWNFVFVQLDQSLLLLMGVTQTVYVGFKYGEEKE